MSTFKDIQIRDTDWLNKRQLQLAVKDLNDSEVGVCFVFALKLSSDRQLTSIPHQTATCVCLFGVSACNMYASGKNTELQKWRRARKATVQPG